MSIAASICKTTANHMKYIQLRQLEEYEYSTNPSVHTPFLEIDTALAENISNYLSIKKRLRKELDDWHGGILKKLKESKWKNI